MKPVSLLRRLYAIIYDYLIVFSILIIMSMPLYNFNLENNIYIKLTLQIYYYLLIQYFFVWFWVNKQETIGMKTWGIKIQNINGERVSYKKAILRFNISIISLLIFGLGFFMSIFRRDKKCLHDIISKTILIKS